MPLPDLHPDLDQLTHAQVHQTSSTLLQASFDAFEINGYHYTHEDVWNVLQYASVHRTTIKSACDSLEHAPSHSWVYTALNEELLEQYSLEDIEKQTNDALQQALPKRLHQRPQKIAIDLVLIPYYGDADTPGVVRSQAKKSTTKFFCYASAYLIKKNKRVTLSFTYVRPEDTLLELLQRLLGRVGQLGITLKRLYLDRAFAQVAVLSYLARQSYVSVVALPKRGKVLKELQRGKRSFTTEYTMSSREHGSVTFPLWVACRYQKGKAKKHGVAYLFFAVLGVCKSTPLQVAEEYRHRFGIEASYRIMNAMRAITTSPKEALRLLLVALAFLLSNLWVWFKWSLLLISRRKLTRQPIFPLDRFGLFIAESIKDNYGVLKELKL